MTTDEGVPDLINHRCTSCDHQLQTGASATNEWPDLDLCNVVGMYRRLGQEERDRCQTSTVGTHRCVARRRQRNETAGHTPRLFGCRHQNLGADVVQVDHLFIEAQEPLVELSEQQQVVHDLHHSFYAAFDVVNVIIGYARQTRSPEELAVAMDHVQWRTQFVTDARQERTVSLSGRRHHGERGAHRQLLRALEELEHETVASNHQCELHAAFLTTPRGDRHPTGSLLLSSVQHSSRQLQQIRVRQHRLHVEWTTGEVLPIPRGHPQQLQVEQLVTVERGLEHCDRAERAISDRLQHTVAALELGANEILGSEFTPGQHHLADVDQRERDLHRDRSS
ncbi:unannotated protein [freshwater metagenome]|uniref:Unannotated protein n=1 Tax=freshwater metagenome TaxID=449393 RepID=A0A6J7C6T8_9ZZZZ